MQSCQTSIRSVGYKSINRKISSRALPSLAIVGPSPSFAYHKTRHKLKREVHFVFFNKAQRLVQCPSIVSWYGFVRAGVKLDRSSLPVSLPAWAALHSSGWALSHSHQPPASAPHRHTFTPALRWFLSSLDSPKTSLNYWRYFHFKSKSYFFQRGFTWYRKLQGKTFPNTVWSFIGETKDRISRSSRK